MRAFERDVIFEMLSLGKTVKVNAVDVETGMEISLMAADGTPTSTLYQVAYEKLLYRLGKIAKNN
ncbi:MAG: hypothetical protein J0G29_07110 [Alphaproteobacteria bacterium]|nr:hypothetical protein [Alphaproteobacteria bacterium]OJV47641.1 MAG: hypothetical protein BGO28_07375 [Alphaproteobacteria bacterium 43-37]